MKTRALLELTLDLANPSAELTDAISAVLGSIPPGQRESVLRSLDEAVGVALAEFDTETAVLTAKTEASA